MSHVDVALLVLGMIGMLGIGHRLGAASGIARAAELERERERLSAERADLLESIARVADLVVVRTPAEAVELVREREDARRPPPPPPKPPPWQGDPRVEGFNPKLIVKAGRRLVQLRSGPPGNETIHHEIPLEDFGEGGGFESFTPDHPA